MTRPALRLVRGCSYATAVAYAATFCFTGRAWALGAALIAAGSATAAHIRLEGE